MFDVAPTEFLLVAFVALVVIGPKDLPKALRFVGHWVGKARNVARQFRSGFDTMVREAELEDMEKRWAAENARIMGEHPATALPSAPSGEVPPAGPVLSTESAATEPAKAEPEADIERPLMVEKPVVTAAADAAPRAADDKAPS